MGKDPMRTAFVSNGLGFMVLALFAFVVMRADMSGLVPTSDMPLPLWFLVYLVWAVFSYFVWHHHSSPRTPGSWLTVAGATVLAAVLWFGASRLVARLWFGDAEPGLSRLFDLLVTLLLAPGATGAALAGAVRAAVLGRGRG